MTFIRKVASAIAIFIIGNALDIAGFIEKTDAVPNPVQPESAVIGIRLIMIFSWVVIMGIGYVLSGKFNITPEISKRVKYLINKEELTTEEMKEKDQILKEFV